MYNFLRAVNAGERLKLTVASAGGYQFGDALQIDDFRIDVIPEPSTLVLLGMGALALVAYASRYRKPWGTPQKKVRRGPRVSHVRPD